MITTADDLFHAPATADHFLTETNWWNFYVPEAKIDAQLYIFFRPNLGTTYAGIYVCDDFCKHFSDALYFDTWLYLPMPKGNLDDYYLENGMHVKVLQPLWKYQLDYEPPTNSSFHLTFEGLTDPLDYNEGRELEERDSFIRHHIEQVGRVSGELVVDGRKYDVNCVTHRDHSWNAVRRENPGWVPNLCWQSAHFGEDIWIQLWLWYGEGIMTDLAVGFVYEHGRPRKIVAAQRETKWDDSGLEPREVRLAIETVDGRAYRLEGLALNMFPWAAVFNWLAYTGLVEWRMNGKIGYGMVNDVRDLDWVRRRKLRRREAFPDRGP